MINYDYNNLMEKFKSITKMQWVEGINNYTNSAGLTFESLLDKKVIVCIFLIIKV